MTLQANLEDPDAFYLIMEDDSYPVHDFETRYPAVLAELRALPARWHWVYLAVHETFAHLNTKSIAGKQLINDAPRMYGTRATCSRATAPVPRWKESCSAVNPRTRRSTS